MMKRIFENGDEPLYGRRDSAILLNPFRTDVLRLILHDHNPNFKPDDLLCLYPVQQTGSKKHQMEH